MLVMRPYALSLMSLLAASLLLGSCAQVQTHLRIREKGTTYEGIVVDPPRVLYSQGGRSYLGVDCCRMEKEYPILRDKVFLTEQMAEPENRILCSASGADAPQRLYVPLSAATAQVLTSEQGYCTMDVLLEELRARMPEARKSLPGAAQQPVRAMVDGERCLDVFEETRSPKKPSTARLWLSRVDRAVVDAPATLLYNVAIPVMEPFVFFYEFFSDEDDGTYRSELSERLQNHTTR